MTQAEALNILKTGANVFLTGEPGAGKTHTVNSYISYLRDSNIEPAVTASTGIAATHINGMTIHSWSGIGIRPRLDKYDLDKIASSEYIAKRIHKTRVLIIDEISMLSADTLDMVDMVCREVKQNTEPFGGIQIVLVGDFFQLPPIIKRDFYHEEKTRKQNSFLEEESNSQIPKVFAYDSTAWGRTDPVICYLTEQHRQDDESFLKILAAIRSDEVSEEDFEKIITRKINRDSMPLNITKLFSHNVDVDKVNNIELLKLDKDVKSFVMSTAGNDKLVDTLKKGCLSPENLELKVGAVVMCTKNNPKERFANGTLGTVTSFEEFTGYPIIKTKNGRSIVISPMDWAVEENGKIRAQITQFPLRLAWAITVHKSQGMSMDAAIMDLSQVFEFGQGYVALSRVRKLSGIYLLGINERAFKVHPEILEKDIFFKDRSRQAVEVFGNLSENEIKKMHDDFIISSGGKIKKPFRSGGEKKEGKSVSLIKSSTKSFEEIPEKYPNAYRPWNENQDAKLTELYTSGSSIPELVETFGRKRGAITSRLVKLGLRE
ncbi:MAG: PIF1 family DEAD/DEAH box helicase [Patescibacteria group bacterium]